MYPYVHKQIHDLLQALSRVLPSTDFGIAGGCARDLFHGREPRDIDIVIVANNLSVWETMAKLGYVMEHDGAPSESDSDDVSSRWVLIEKYTSTEYELPVDILYAAEHDSIPKIIGDFDFNINQACILWLHQAVFGPVYMGVGEHGWYCGAERKLIELPGRHISDERRAHIHDVARRYGWSYDRKTS